MLLIGCGTPDQVALIAEYTAPAALTVISDTRMHEISGLAASRHNPGYSYVHNDSGDAARVFLIDRQGAVAAVVNLIGVQAVDFEDIALAPGTDANTWDVCVADIGDNSATRSEVAIYRFPEIDLPSFAGATLSVTPTAYRLSYPIGPTDAEALCIHPTSGAAYILTKQITGTSTVFKLPAPWPSEQVVTLTRVAELELPRAASLAGRIVTAADIAPDGRRLAARCYVEGWEWTLADDTSTDDFDRIFSTSPRALVLAQEPQGEALGYAHAGDAILTISEGSGPTLFEVCRPTDSDQ